MAASDSQRATTPARTGPRSPPPNRYRDSALGVFAVLLALRIVNALTLRTFFQPDEYFQSLEPAWQLAFGPASNAYITWEWRTQLRSSLHPALFAAVYWLAAKCASLCGLTVASRANLLLAAPKVTQALCAALLDFYTWRLAEKAYGPASRSALVSLAVSACSPWQWFCSTRTLSNCLETALTAAGVYYWPWQLPQSKEDRNTRDHDTTRQPNADALASANQLRLSLLLAACACILRPTNVLVWLSLSLPTYWQASHTQRHVLVREIFFCGLAVLACSVVSDRLYYHVWTFPPLRFLYFNIAQSLAVFYGKNRADYYVTEGLPLLLTTALPFATVGIWRALSGFTSRDSAAGPGSGNPRMRARLAWTVLIVTLSLSLISHKEVRFLYPVLPFLHVLAADPLAQFVPPQAPIARKAIIALLLVINLSIAGYTSQVHQRGVIDVLSYLRHKHEAHNRLSTTAAGAGDERIASISNTTVAFLMPCHSTPWRSHLVHSQINAWALTCEPPLDVPLAERATYLDEADQFFIRPGPAAWLDSYMEHVQTVTASGSRSGAHWARQDPKFKRTDRRAWPQNVVFFAQLEPVLRDVLAGTEYRECWRGFNSHFHDDWRRVGDVVVWCRDA